MSDVHFTIHVEVDISDADQELRRLGEEPSPAVHAFFEGIFRGQFEQAKHQVHRLTTSLRNSGDADVSFTHGLMEGEMHFGGAGPGPLSPVKWAKAELGRGGSHYFFDGVDQGSPLYEETILSHYRGL